MGKVALYGREVDYDAAVNLMDDEIRERLHSNPELETEQAFLDAYCIEHERAFRDDFKI